jgi:predicted Zn-dependent peptidase
MRSALTTIRSPLIRLIVYGQPLEKSVGELEKALRQEIDRTRETPPSADEVGRVKRASKRGTSLRRIRSSTSARLFSQYEMIGDWRRIEVIPSD